MYVPSLLTAQQLKLLAVLCQRNGPVHVERLVEAIYGDRPDGGPDNAVKVIRVQICRARQRLAPHRIIILTFGGERGYMIKVADRIRLIALLNAEADMGEIDSADVAA